MIHILGFILAIVIAAATGFVSTYLAVERGHGFESIAAGVWTAWPKAGAPDADPYAKAVIARTGRIPLSPGEGLVLEATSDDGGSELDGRCTYRIAGELPPARIWTVTAYDRQGSFRDNPAHRFSFTSTEIVRDATGRFEIVLSPQVQAGNWLPTPTDQRIVLMLRLYDTPLSAGAARIEGRTVPIIHRMACA